ncbi:MAG: FAD-dependent oxidoreductase [Alphaproteobacteria bacterium]|nr:FAD-dependent oxidoreductase [Alphaproteobacteria bacterium]
MQNYDCIVIGGGLVGSQAVYRLSQTPGYKVAMLEQYPEGPSMGASFGETRIVRAVEWEVDIYTPMVLRSLEIYHALNAECAAYGIDPVFYETGGLYGGPADSDIFKGAQESVIRHNIPHDILDAAAVKKRFPVLNIPDDYKLVHDKQSGILVPERMLEFHYMLARQNGADLHFETRFKDISSLPDGRLLVTTNKGQFTTKKLIIAAGAWSGKLLEDMGLRCVIDNSTPERGYVAWIDPADDDADYRWENLPVLNHREKLCR